MQTLSDVKLVRGPPPLLRLLTSRHETSWRGIRTQDGRLHEPGLAPTDSAQENGPPSATTVDVAGRKSRSVLGSADMDLSGIQLVTTCGAS